MKTKKLLVGEKRTKILLANKGEEIIELQRLNGVWYKIGEREKTKLSRKGVFRQIFDAEYFVDFNTKKPFRVVLNRSLAAHYCHLGYILYDSHLNRYELINSILLRNHTEELADLPETERYILDPFQKYIAEEKKNPIPRSKEQKQKQEEPKVAYPIADALEKVKDKIAIEEKPSEEENNDWEERKINKIASYTTILFVGIVLGSSIASLWKSRNLDYFNYAS